MMISEKIGAARAEYVFTFRVDPDGGYSVRCAAFPEIVSHESSLEEARVMAREALELCLEVYSEEGRPLPASESDTRTTIREAAPANLVRS